MKRNDLFPKQIQLAAQHSQRAHGVPACVTLAQWALESDYGKAVIGAHNYFGIKWRKSCPYPFLALVTHEQVRGNQIKTTAKFIDFPTDDAAFAWHGSLITSIKGPYSRAARNLRAHPDDWQTFMYLMARVYATDLAYEQKLGSIIARYRLYELNLPPLSS